VNLVYAPKCPDYLTLIPGDACLMRHLCEQPLFKGPILTRDLDVQCLDVITSPDHFVPGRVIL